MIAALALTFFLSGAAALIFETLWFRLAGLTFGNSAWASAIVLASFMAGLAAGNLLSVRLARSRQHPLRLYALLEISVAFTGLLLVLLLPAASSILAPVFRPILDSPSTLNFVRLLFAFLLMVVPATAMGATLPVVVKAVAASDANFGSVLGLLYGVNTTGAVLGALGGELVLVRIAGIAGAGFVAAAMSTTAAAFAWTLFRSGAFPVVNGATSKLFAGRLPIRLLAAAFGSGFALLALEVIWFRFVILFVASTAVAFAVMLAVILLGIAIGALIAAAALIRFREADRYVSLVAIAAAAALIVCYAGFSPLNGSGGALLRADEVALIGDALRMMLPVSCLSGMLFTFLGHAVRRHLEGEVQTAAVLTVANTLGAAMGPIVGGFILIPRFGIERSFFVIALVYASIALLTATRRMRRGVLIGGFAALVFAIATFPFGLMANTFLPMATAVYLKGGSKIAVVREGPIETAVLLRKDYESQPYAYRLFTNGYSMSATTFPSNRYMSAFVYLPVALRPRPKTALLISYGVGVTAKRLAENHDLVSIDVVDISETILSLSGFISPGKTDALHDPRVRVHIEDGRFFLLATDRRFDFITGEPPPPKSAGVVSLYTREYFQLLHERLTEGGITSYWLPVYQLEARDSKAIVRAFCDVFTDCSAWSGAGFEWILVGSRGLKRAPGVTDFARQWSEQPSGREMQRLGIETPAQTGAMFLADAAGLNRFAGDVAPLTDNHPLRLSPRRALVTDREYVRMMAERPAQFEESGWARTMLPPAVRSGAVAYHASQQLVDRLLSEQFVDSSPPPPELLRRVLTTTDLRMLPRLMFGSDAWLEDIAATERARGNRSPRLAYILAVAALGDREYPRARALFAEARSGMPHDEMLPAYEALAASLEQ